jgi:outer membrane protein assembly factor BamB
MLFFGTLEESFCAFDTNKKAFKWCFKTRGSVHSGATLSNDRIFFGDTKGFMYALLADSGELKWQHEFDNEILSSPLVIDGVLFFTDMADTLYSLLADSGELKWKVENESYLKNIVMRGIASPSYSEGLLYQGFSDGYLYCYDSETSEEKFRKKVKETGIFYDVDSPAAIDGDTVFTSSFDGNFIAIDAKSPKSKWELEIPGNGYPAFNKDDLVVSSSEGSLFKVNKEFGNVIWHTRLSKNLTAPIITDDYAFVASDNYFYVVDIANGEVKYEYEPGSGISSELCLINDNIYFISNKGYLYCFK